MMVAAVQKAAQRPLALVSSPYPAFPNCFQGDFTHRSLVEIEALRKPGNSYFAEVFDGFYDSFFVCEH